MSFELHNAGINNKRLVRLRGFYEVLNLVIIPKKKAPVN
jgi:hypothetical protein